MTRMTPPNMRARTEHGRPLLVGSTLITMGIMGLAMKATAGMRGQTLRELVRGRS
jgi:hypothetical protein